MSLKAAWFPKFFLRAPEFSDPDRALAARQIFLIVRAFLISVVILQLLLIILDPRITARWLALLLATVTVSIILLQLNRGGRIRAAALLLVVSLWLLISLFAWTRAGLGTRAAWGYFIVVFIAGMVLGKWYGVAMAMLCSASTLLIALGAPSRSMDPFRFWLINSLFLIVVLLLQDLAGRSIRESLARAHNELQERQLAEREREHVISLLQATLESTADGILEIDSSGKIANYNKRFAQMWHIPESVLVARDDNQALDFVLKQLVDPEMFITKVRELYDSPEMESFDELEFKDGRHFERFSRPQLLNDRPVGRVWSFRDVSERKRGELALRESERRYRSLFDAAGDAIFVMKETLFYDCNSKTLEMFGCRREEIIGAPPDRFSPSLQPDGRSSREKSLEKISAAYAGEPQFFEWVHIRSNGTPFFAEVSLTRISLAAEVLILAIVRDVSERKQLEEQLLQAQKMEAIGNLAGGVAHDFNNILSTIVGYSSLLQIQCPDGSPHREYVERILLASERAANLTRSLLAFSRKQEIDLQPIDLNDAIRGFHKILARLIGEDIEFTLEMANRELMVDADARQIEQVLMNLVNNSREAMSRGGGLTISTAVVSLGDSAGIPAGEYAAVAVTDTGIGIGREIQDRIFEPFFTTKEVGKGTGLGLAIVFGIVKNHNGFIALASSPGQGATVTVYLPLSSTPGTATPRLQAESIPVGRETILLVEDDPAVRLVTRAMLEEFGYNVLEAADGVSAQYVFREHFHRIDLVVCDLLMPRLNGRETLAALRKIKVGIPAIFISGYASDVIARKGLADAGARLLMKPLSPETLLRAVRVLLDQQGPPPQP